MPASRTRRLRAAAGQLRWVDIRRDTASYANLLVGLKINLTGKNTGDAAGDTYDSVEAIQGTQGKDILIGAASRRSTLCSAERAMTTLDVVH